MAEGGYPAVGTGGPADSPLPAGYGSLDDGFLPAESDAAEGAAPADGHPVRPWTRRPRPPLGPTGPEEPRRVTAGNGGPAPAPAAGPVAAPPVGPPPVGPPPTGAPSGPVVGDRPARSVPLDEGADIREGPVSGTRHPRQKVQVVRGVRSRRLIRRVDVWTVFKVSFIFYLLALIVLLVAGIILWNVASSLGFLTSIEKSVRTLFSLKSFVFHPGATLAYAGAIGAVLCLVGVLVNTIAAITYNLISDLVGGIQVVVVSESD
jgi:hypothetical protein